MVKDHLNASLFPVLSSSFATLKEKGRARGTLRKVAIPLGDPARVRLEELPDPGDV